MHKKTSLSKYFTTVEKLMWSCSAAMIILSYLLFDRSSSMTLAASLIGVTALIFTAKGNPIGPALMVVFSIFYGIISYSFAYYGEMITYLGMSLPMSLISLIEWMRHPFQGSHAQVQVEGIRRREIPLMCLITVAVTVILGVVLAYFHTANLPISIFSVSTSFLAVYLCFRRDPHYALAYAVNDVVLIIMWIMASIREIRYLSVVICFLVFLVHDTYGHWNWMRMRTKQVQANAAQKQAEKG